MAGSEGAKSPPWYNPKAWSKKTWIIIGAVAAVIIAAVIVAAVEVTKANEYPGYSALNYTLSETYSTDSL